MKTASEPVSFRASTAMLSQIDARRKPFGISRGEWVRGIVMQHLSGADATALSGQLDGLAATVSELQRAQSTAKNDMARQLYLLLIELGGRDPEQARELVVNRFLSQRREAD
ncbi:MAG: hypothetical protein ACK58H_00195 [Planctomyces sp.]|jgi:hypothetical protein